MTLARVAPRHLACIAVAAFAAALLAARPARAQHMHGAGAAAEDHEREFAHPLIAESVSPDSKLRLVLEHARGPGETEIGLEGEYALRPSFSLELGLPLSRSGPDGRQAAPGPLELRAKLARYLGDDGVLGAGLTAGVPTRETSADLGGGRSWGLEPFLDAGVRHGAWEWVGFGKLGWESAAGGRAADARLGYNASSLYRVSERLHAVAELDGDVPLRGDESGRATLNLSPGLKLWPGLGPHVMLGAAWSIPLLSRRDYASLLSLSAFYHF